MTVRQQYIRPCRVRLRIGVGSRQWIAGNFRNTPQTRCAHLKEDLIGRMEGNGRNFSTMNGRLTMHVLQRHGEV